MQADVVNILMDRIDFVTLNLFTCVLPLLTGLMDSKVDRYLFSVSFFFFFRVWNCKEIASKTIFKHVFNVFILVLVDITFTKLYTSF